MVDDAGQYQARRDIPNMPSGSAVLRANGPIWWAAYIRPTSAENTLAIIAGTTIVALFAVYIVLKWRSFSA